MKAVVVAKILQICNDLVDNVDNNPYNNLDNNPSKVVVVVAGQDVLPHYTTLCLFNNCDQLSSQEPLHAI